MLDEETDLPDSPPPIAVKGGIKARSIGDTIAEMWWTRQFIDFMENFNIRSRVMEGRAYARSGQITRLAITRGSIDAEVQGTQELPHRVTFTFAGPSGAARKALAKHLSKQLKTVARLLAGELPEELEALFKKAKVPLFPTLYGDLKTECSCRDWSNPCKHIVAVWYVVAEALNQDPMILLRMRGIEREDLLDWVGHEGQEGENPSESERTTLIHDAQDQSVPEAAEVLPEDPEAFWGQPLGAEFIPPVAHIPEDPAAHPKRLGPLPFWRGNEDFLAALEAFYRDASPVGRDVFLGEKSEA